MAQNEQHEDKEPQTGPRLGRALGGLRKETVFISPSIDEAVLEQARQHLARLRARRVRRQRAQWLALAACMVLVAVMAQAVFHRGDGKQFAREDLNRDGQVDILDAFQLAREIKEGNAQAGTEDFNGDGKVDAADVEILARRAVSLEKGGPS
jgi:hypothetical protein